MFGRRERRHGDANGAGTVPARFRRVPPSGPRGRTAKKTSVRHCGTLFLVRIPVLLLPLALRRHPLLLLLFLHGFQLRVQRGTGPLLLGLLPDPNLRAGTEVRSVVPEEAAGKKRNQALSKLGKPPDVTRGRKPRESPRRSVGPRALPRRRWRDPAPQRDG